MFASKVGDAIDAHEFAIKADANIKQKAVVALIASELVFVGINVGSPGPEKDKQPPYLLDANGKPKLDNKGRPILHNVSIVVGADDRFVRDVEAVEGL